MLIYLLSVVLLLANAQEEDCWQFGVEIQGETATEDVTSFGDCYDICILILREDCYYITYIPLTNWCAVGPIDSYVIDRKTTGYVFTDIDCLEKDLTERDACRIDDILTEYTTNTTYIRSEGTIAECDEFCLGYDWCAATTWWPKGDTDEGYCQTSETTTQVRSFTAEAQCLESGYPCATGNVLDPDYGCVEYTATDPQPLPTTPPPLPTTPPPLSIITPKSIKKCKKGKSCKVKFILLPPVGVKIKRKHLRVCKLDGNELVGCKKPRKRGDVVKLKLTSDMSQEYEGSYVCQVKYEDYEVVSQPVEVVLK